MPQPITIAPGVFLWREKFSPIEQKTLRDDVMARLEQAPLYRPVMPDTGTPFSVEESNFGRLGWVSDKSGYRYQPIHPVTGAAWPDIPQPLLDLWAQINTGPAPECCLVNFYLGGAKMGLHQDRDEKDVTAAVIGVSLGDSALFRIGGTFKNGKWGRGGKTVSVTLASGDVIAFGGTARLAYHGIDRTKPGTSQLLAGGGRLSLTLRRVEGGRSLDCALRGALATLSLADSQKKAPRRGAGGQKRFDERKEQPGGDYRLPQRRRGLKASGGQCQQPKAVFTV